MRYTLLLGFLGASVASPALADICAWNDPGIARRAAAMIKPGDTIQTFCPGCNDTVATPVQVGTVSVAPTSDPKYRQLKLNGADADLAYTYIRSADGHWVNLGALVGCSRDNDSPKTLRPDQVVADAKPTPPLAVPTAPTVPAAPATLGMQVPTLRIPGMVQAPDQQPPSTPAPAADGKIGRTVTLEGWTVRYDPMPAPATQPFRCILSSPGADGTVRLQITYIKAEELHVGLWNSNWKLAESARGQVKLQVAAQNTAFEVIRWSPNTVGATFSDLNNRSLEAMTDLIADEKSRGEPLVVTLPNGQQSVLPRVSSAVQNAFRSCVNDLEQARRSSADPFAPEANVNSGDPFSVTR